jgi:hypothetical protein
MVLDKKMAAALAAVTYYIESEEEMVFAQAAAGRGGVLQPAAARPAAAINLWGLSGRQAMMQMRNQMQLRGFHGARLR